MITKYLPTFKVFEVGSLTGLRAGHMLSQRPAHADIKKVDKNGYNFIENGIIVGLNADGTVGNFDKSAHKVAFVHYTEELNTFMDELKYYALPVEEVGDTYPRCIALYAGDEFCTNNVAADVDNAVAAKVVDGVLTLQTAADADSLFAVSASTLPTGEKAYDFVFLGV
jgi:hypothetical protein